MRKTTFIALAAVAAAFGMSHSASAAGKFKSVHSFCAQADCTDGAQPWGLPVSDGAGNYYATTANGGAKGKGTIYRMHFDGAHWKYTRLYTFCTDKKCTDGATPHGTLVLDTKGNLYGTAYAGGDKTAGTVFELSPDGAGWKYTRLHSFCTEENCTDGATLYDVTLSYRGASSGALYDGTSPLFGTTYLGGAHNSGTVFSLTPSKGKWTHKVIYHFCSEPDCTDGQVAYTGVMVDGSGNLFGTAVLGGDMNAGTIYELSPVGAKWKYTRLYSFCAQANCPDGATPVATPVMDGAGNLYGTAFAGGAGVMTPGGTVYKLVPNGVHSKFTKLHDFCNVGACTDGSSPFSSPAIDADGHLLGTTYFGGDSNQGTIWRLAGTKLNVFTRPVSFGSAEAPGNFPLSGLRPDGAAYLGTSAAGGANAQGDFFKFTP